MILFWSQSPSRAPESGRGAGSVWKRAQFRGRLFQTLRRRTAPLQTIIALCYVVYFLLVWEMTR
jgi:hypothetical protein